MSDGRYASRPLPIWVSVYVTAVIAVGITVVGLSLRDIQLHPLGYQWYMLAALTLISGSATVNLPSAGISISVSETFVFFSVLLFGPAAGTVMVALDGLVISFWVARRKPEWYRPLFNMAAPAISLWSAAHVLFAIAGTDPLLNRPSSANTLVLPLATCAIVYFGLNSSLIAVPTAAQRGLSPYRVWRESSLLLSLNYFFGAALALLLVVYTRDVDLTFVGVIIPLLLVSYLTYKTTVGRIEDANEHLEEMNRLYLSTVETLAMAIDAKDQVTHGHIRRVQVFAVNLARAIGIRDTALIKAIEAAALLHDMGKLAVPEYILNKPGSLTPAEFDRMKLHASVGADILSAIAFPYPVVPIVRHHHENWDGTGYPDGLKGTGIPIGARILSVVDCFDALTSDRPYRPRLRDEDAIRILMERRGVMYDPLVVDTFIRVHNEVSPDSVDAGPRTHAFDEIAIARRTSSTAGPVFAEIAASADEMLTLYELSRSLSGKVSVREASEIVTNHLRRLIPAALYVFFLYDPDRGELEARHAAGDNADLIRGLRITLGQRLSGWVAAHNQTIVNSDPVLDLGEIARVPSAPLRSCLSTPLRTREDTVGVLSVYSGNAAAFNDDHRRVIEAISRQVAQTLSRAAESDTATLDELNGATSSRQSEQTLTDAMHERSSPFGLLDVRVSDVKAIKARFGDGVVQLFLQHVVQQLQTCVRVGDVVFRRGADEFVIMLDDGDERRAADIVDRIFKMFAEHPVTVSQDTSLHVRVSIGIAFSPYDGKSVGDLLASASSRSVYGPGTITAKIH